MQHVKNISNNAQFEIEVIQIEYNLQFALLYFAYYRGNEMH